MTLIERIESAVGKKAVRNMLPMQPGDIVATHAEIEELRQAVGFAPHTPLKEGVENFAAWFRVYYGGERSLAQVEKEDEVHQGLSH